jgi:hypothetical protein
VFTLPEVSVVKDRALSDPSGPIAIALRSNLRNQ